jgi:hypothetical protein
MTNTKTVLLRSMTLSDEIRALVETLPRNEDEAFVKWLDRCRNDGIINEAERRMFGAVPGATWLRIEGEVL